MTRLRVVKTTICDFLDPKRMREAVHQLSRWRMAVVRCCVYSDSKAAAVGGEGSKGLGPMVPSSAKKRGEMWLQAGSPRMVS